MRKPKQRSIKQLRRFFLTSIATQCRSPSTERPGSPLPHALSLRMLGHGFFRDTLHAAHRHYQSFCIIGGLHSDSTKT